MTYDEFKASNFDRATDWQKEDIKDGMSQAGVTDDYVKEVFDTLTYEELISIAGRRMDEKHYKRLTDDYASSFNENLKTDGKLHDKVVSMRDRLIDYHFIAIGKATAAIEKAKYAIEQSNDAIKMLDTTAVVEDASFRVINALQG